MRDCDLINEFADFIRYGKRRAGMSITSYRSELVGDKVCLSSISQPFLHFFYILIYRVIILLAGSALISGNFYKDAKDAE